MHLLKYTGGSNLSGYSFLTEPGKATDEGETLSCSHCQYTWIVKPGSGNKRGWCFKCNKPVCGKMLCNKRCEPWEKHMEIVEAKAKFWTQMQKLAYYNHGELI